MIARRFPFSIPAQRASDGSVLIIVLWVSLGMMALTITFGHSMVMAYRSADNELAGYQAEEAIDAGLRYAETVLTNTGTPGLFPDPTTYQSEAVPLGEATFWLIGRDNNNPASTTPVFSLVDEASKLNLNTASTAMLETLPGITPDQADAIVDWRTSTTSSSAATGSFDYQSMQPPYTDKNAPFESIEELALVYGMDSLTIFGEDANLNGTLDPNEDDGDKNPPSDNSNGQLEPGLLEYVTAYTREPNTKSDGSTKTDVSKISPLSDAVSQLLQQTFGASQATTFQQNLTAYAPTAPPLQPGSDGSTPQINSLLQFYIASGMTADQFAQISDSITVSQGKYTQGLINVNTASQTVLAAIPGIGDSGAASLISARQSRSLGDTSYVWICDILGKDNVAQYGKWVTGKSYQITADIAAVGRNGRGYRRTKFVIDMSSGTPVIIYRRNLSHLGWSLGRDTRDTLATRTNGL